jgi:branched-chain amino acid transport system ATP-binding protein
MFVYISTSELHHAGSLKLDYFALYRRIFTNLTVLKNLKVGRRSPHYRPYSRAAAVWKSKETFQTRSLPWRHTQSIRSGEQQMLMVVLTTMGNPYLVLPDDTPEGVAPVIVSEMAQIILELKSQGARIMLSEQNMLFAELVSDCIFKLFKVQICYQPNIAELSAEIDSRQDYLSV